MAKQWPEVTVSSRQHEARQIRHLVQGCDHIDCHGDIGRFFLRYGVRRVLELKPVSNKQLLVGTEPLCPIAKGHTYHGISVLGGELHKLLGATLFQVVGHILCVCKDAHVGRHRRAVALAAHQSARHAWQQPGPRRKNSLVPRVLSVRVARQMET